MNISKLMTYFQKQDNILGHLKMEQKTKKMGRREQKKKKWRVVEKWVKESKGLSHPIFHNNEVMNKTRNTLIFTSN